MAGVSTGDILVDVGVISNSGSMRFIPFAATAPNGTTVRFRWTGGNFSVTQSSPSAPCTPIPIPGGFDSGPSVFGRDFQTGTVSPTELPGWSFTVDDDRDPLFFFVRQSNQTSPCSGGGFFLVNSAQNGTISSSLLSSQNPTGTNSPTAPGFNPGSPTTSIPPSSITRTHVPAIVGSIVGSLVVLFLCVTAILIRRRRIFQHGIRHKASRSLGANTECGLSGIGGNQVDTRPDPLVLFEKDASAADSSLSVPNTAFGAALPTAAELSLANMADEMRVLRGQLQRLEQERSVLENAPPDDLPPEYATSN